MIKQINKKFLRDFKHLFFTYVFRFSLGFFTVSIVSRYLGPEKYGIYSYAISLIAFFEILYQTINQELFKKYILNNSQYEDEILSSYINFTLIISFILFLIINTFLWVLNFETGEKRVLLSLFSIGFVFKLADCFTNYFVAKQSNNLVANTELGTSSLFNVSRLALTSLKGSLTSFGALIILQRFSYFAFNIFFLLRNFQFKYRFSFDSKIILSLIRESFPLFIANIAAVIFYKIDQVMIGRLLGDVDVGMYSISVKLSEPWIFLSTIMTQITFPTLVKAYDPDNQSQLFKKLNKINTVLLYSSIFIIIGTYLFGSEVISFIFSNKYQASFPILKIHILGILFIFWLNTSKVYEVISGNVKITFIKSLTASVVNVVLNYYLIRKIGVVGASFATVISFALSSFLLNAVFPSNRSLFFNQLYCIFFWKTLRHK